MVRKRKADDTENDEKNNGQGEEKMGAKRKLPIKKPPTKRSAKGQLNCKNDSNF